MIERVTDITSVPSLQQEWHQLYLNSGEDNVFLTYPWIRNWMATFSRGQHMVLLNREQGHLTSIGIFRQDHKGVSFISSPHSCWPNILYSPDVEHVYQPFFDYFEKQRWSELILMTGVQNTREFDKRLRTDASKHYYIFRSSPVFSCAIDVSVSMTEYLASRSKKVKSELMRKFRKLHREQPDTKLRRYDAPMDLDRVFEKIRDVELDSWKYENHTAIISTAEETKHYRGILGLNQHDVQGAVYFLESQNIPFAFVLGVFHRDRFYAIKTSYRKKWAAYSPGQVLFYRVIEQLCDSNSGTRTVELLGNETRWIQELSTHKRPLCDVQLSRKSLKTAAYKVYRQGLRPWAKQVVRRHRILLYAKEIASTFHKRHIRRAR